MMAKTKDLVREVWRIGLDVYPAYVSSDEILEIYQEMRGNYSPKGNIGALSRVLVDCFGFRRLGFRHNERTMYYNPWHPDSPESEDDSKLIYPVWLED